MLTICIFYHFFVVRLEWPSPRAFLPTRNHGFLMFSWCSSAKADACDFEKWPEAFFEMLYIMIFLLQTSMFESGIHLWLDIFLQLWLELDGISKTSGKLWRHYRGQHWHGNNRWKDCVDLLYLWLMMLMKDCNKNGHFWNCHHGIFDINLLPEKHTGVTIYGRRASSKDVAWRRDVGGHVTSMQKATLFYSYRLYMALQ